MKKAILDYQAASAANTGDGANEETANALASAQSALNTAALACDASTLPDDAS